MEIQENYVQLQINSDDFCYLKALEILGDTTKDLSNASRSYWVHDEIMEAVNFYKRRVINRDN